MSWRQGRSRCTAGLFILVCFVCVCVQTCIPIHLCVSVRPVVTVGVSPVSPHVQKRVTLLSVEEERCIEGNEAPEAVEGSEVMPSVNFSESESVCVCVCARTGVRNTSPQALSRECRLVSLFGRSCLRFVFSLEHSLFSPLIWGNTLAVWQKSCRISHSWSPCVVRVSAVKRQDTICAYLCSHSWHSFCPVADKQGRPRRNTEVRTRVCFSSRFSNHTET